MIFTARSAVDYQAALVTEDFLNGGAWDRAATGYVMKANLGELTQMQEQASNLTRLSSQACLEAYAFSMFETDWRNVLVVTALSSTNTSLIGVYHHEAASAYLDIVWPCHGDIQYPFYGTTLRSCNLRALREIWTIPNVPGCPSATSASFGYNLIDGSNDCEQTYTAPVQYCLAEPFAAHCTINVSTKLLTTVIVCNVLKICCMLATLCVRGFKPLANVGDAISSFLQRPDPNTANKGALEVSVVSSGVWRDLDSYTPFPWTRQKRRWWYAVPRPQLSLTFLMYG